MNLLDELTYKHEEKNSFQIIKKENFAQLSKTQTIF